MVLTYPRPRPLIRGRASPIQNPRHRRHGAARAHRQQEPQVRVRGAHELDRLPYILRAAGTEAAGHEQDFDIIYTIRERVRGHDGLTRSVPRGVGPRGHRVEGCGQDPQRQRRLLRQQVQDVEGPEDVQRLEAREQRHGEAGGR